MSEPTIVINGPVRLVVSGEVSQPVDVPQPDDVRRSENYRAEIRRLVEIINRADAALKQGADDFAREILLEVTRG